MARSGTNRGDGPTTRSRVKRWVFALAVVVGLFVGANLLAFGVTSGLRRVVETGGPGTLSQLLTSVAGLQVVGFGTATLVVLVTRQADWRSWLRIGPLTEWTLFHGTAAGLALMVLTSGATVLVNLLDITPPNQTVAIEVGPLFYLGLFVVSTVVVVPLEEAFFRGILQRRLGEAVHVSAAIGVASLLFAVIHTGVRVTAVSELASFTLFFSFGVVLGVSYAYTENLLVPIIGHAVFNGVQVAVRAAEALL